MNIDGYLCVSLPELPWLCFRHLETAMDFDDGLLSDARLRWSPTALSDICGYTEWAIHDWPAASLGWDWIMLLPKEELTVRQHSIRTNLRVIDANGKSLGMARSLELLHKVIDTLPWQQHVVKTIHAVCVNPIKHSLDATQPSPVDLITGDGSTPSTSGGERARLADGPVAPHQGRDHER
ncbi:DUF4902 domain-containing protein [Piscinibacter sp.]|uniref:DUF4902 domain-containing protein n=1 Tax=Piscinibacter sp. TaxID=1903157 RepID=UPI0039E4A904